MYPGIWIPERFYISDQYGYGLSVRKLNNIYPNNAFCVAGNAEEPNIEFNNLSFGESTGKNFKVGDTVKAKITAISSNPLQFANLWLKSEDNQYSTASIYATPDESSILTGDLTVTK